MAIQINIFHDFCVADFELDPEELVLLQKVCSYFVKDAERSQLYLDGTWDGTKTLFKKTRNRPQGRFPTGILDIVIEKLKHELFSSVHLVDHRTVYERPTQVNLIRIS